MSNLITLLVVVILGALGGISIKTSLHSFTPYLFLTLRFSLALLTLLPFVRWKTAKSLFKTKALKLHAVSLLAVANVILFALGVQLTTIISTSVIYTLIPLMVGILTHLFFNKKFSKHEIIGVVVGLIGAVVVVLIPYFEGASSDIGSIEGNLLLLCATASFALYTVLLGGLHSNYSKKDVTLALFINALLVQLVVLVVTFLSGAPLLHSTPSTIHIVGLLFSGIMSTAIWYLLYQRLVSRGGAVYASFVFYLNPIAGAIFGSLILNEKITPTLLIGGAITFLGVWLYGRK